MKTNELSAALLGAFLLPLAGVAFAGSCAAPTALGSTPIPNMSVNTCAADAQSGPFNLGGVVGTQLASNGQVYSFTWHDKGVSPNVIATTDQIGGQNAEFYIAPGTDCSNQPLVTGHTGTPLDLAAAGLTDGNSYVLVVTKDPSTSAGCGTISLNVGTLPVQLQKFSAK